MGVRAVVVHNEVKFDLAGKLLIQAVEKFDELLVAMACIALADDFALRDLQSGEKRGGAVALVIVGHGPAPALFERQARLGAIQRLDLALLVHTEHQRFFRRVEIEAHYVGELLQKLRITGEFETLGPVRLEAVALPDAVHGGFAYTLGLGHRAAAPVGCSRWLGLNRGVHDFFDLPGGEARLAAAARRDFPQAIRPLRQEASAPQRHRLEVDAKLRRDRLVLLAAARSQDDLAALGDLLGALINATFGNAVEMIVGYPEPINAFNI